MLMFAAASNAALRSSIHSLLLTAMMLLLTYAPTGVALPTLSLYCFTSGAMSRAEPSEKQNAPKPSEPASAKVGGEPHATHIAGCDGPCGFGKTSRSGMLNQSPSYW